MQKTKNKIMRNNETSTKKKTQKKKRKKKKKKRKKTTATTNMKEDITSEQTAKAGSVSKSDKVPINKLRRSGLSASS